MKPTAKRRLVALSVTTLIFAAVPASAQTDSSRIDELEKQATELVQQLAELRAELDKSRAEAKEQAPAQVTAEEVASLRAETTSARQAAQRAEIAAKEWKSATSVTHLAGYASADWVNPENENSAFVANFNPVFHFQYDEKILWESELEFKIAEDGETNIGLEYSAIDVLLNDNFILVAGKFLSPLGNFRQNGHPSWINKLTSPPPGFGHDGAAPAAEVGVQLRGGMNFGEQRKFTYAGYVGNGPQVVAVDGEIHGIETEGFVNDPDGEKVYGGRLSILPFPKLEIGVSGAFGDVSVIKEDGIDIAGDDPSRNYTILGIDAFYRLGNLDFIGEYISQDLDAQAASVAPEAAKWQSWYVQSSYRFGQDKWEGVVRYTDFTAAEADESQEQLSFGVNYLITSSAMFKVGYELNNSLPGVPADDDRFIAQIAYGY